ncbi:MAG: hypothetical protein KGJ62_03360 [Armatimonadetes bacterium]|nr:hypothetical protein [Armatimonadota bacterium]MDE2205728.1 hypothetical protein [Armatimonadota bacterium]
MISELVRAIRDIVNDERKRAQLIEGSKWNQLCSFLDVLEDTEEAVAAYATQECGSSLGASYIATYGVLQALILQQDAAKHLAEALGLTDGGRANKALRNIRDIRNASTGHPTKRDRPKPTTVHFISRDTLHYGGFVLMSSGGRASDKLDEVDLKDLIAQQAEAIGDILKALLGELEALDKAHRTQFADKSLAAIFSAAPYQSANVAKATRDVTPARVGVGLAAIAELRRFLREFEAALLRRGIRLDAYGPIKKVYDELEHPVAWLAAFLENQRGRAAGSVDARDATIYAACVRARFDSLHCFADDIDEGYAA